MGFESRVSPLRHNVVVNGGLSRAAPENMLHVRPVRST
jgi:hypothetical protein